MSTKKVNKPISSEKEILIERGFNFTDSYYNYLLSNAGWRVHGVHLRRHPDKEAILDLTIKYLEHPNRFIESVNRDPSIMDTEGGVIIALLILENIASGPKNERSKHAAEILRQIGRRDLLPRTPEGRGVKNKTDNRELLFWQYEPEDLIDEVEKYKVEIVELSKSCPEDHRRRRNPPEKILKPKGGPQIYECCLEHAFREITGNDLPEDFSKLGNWKGDYITLIALRFICSKYGTPSRGLHDLYYKFTDKGKFKPPLTPTQFRDKKNKEKLLEKSGLEITGLKFIEKASSSKKQK